MLSVSLVAKSTHFPKISYGSKSVMSNKLFALTVVLLGVILAFMFPSYLRGQELVTHPEVTTSGNFANVELVGQIGGRFRHVTIQGNYAYLAIGPRLQILDISNSDHPTLIGQTQVFTDTIAGVAVSGNYAYVIFSYGGMRIIDVSTPAYPVPLGFQWTNYFPNNGGIIVKDNFAYIADGSLRIIDVANPSAPVEVASQIVGWPIDLALAGNYAYLVTEQNDLTIFDISDPAELELAGSFPTTYEIHAIAVVGNYAYLVDADSPTHSIQIINISNPAAPFEAGTYISPEPLGNITIAENKAYILDLSGLRILDITIPALPTEIGHLAGVRGGWVTIANQYAYVWGPKLRIVDVADPTTPYEVGSYQLIGDVKDVQVIGDTAYVSAYSVFTLDIANPAMPSQLGFQTEAPPSTAIHVKGDYAYVAAYHDGLRVLNVSNPSAPIEVGHYDTPGQAVNVVVEGNYAYVSDSEEGMRIVNVANPAAPFEVGFYQPYAEVFEVVVQGDLAYVGGPNGTGFRVVDISDPSNPEELTSTTPLHSAENIVVVGDLAYVVGSGGFVHVFNVTDPANPKEVTSFYIDFSVGDIAIVGDYIYGANSVAGLKILNIADLDNPFEVGSYDTPGQNWSLEATEEYIYLADLEGGLFIFRFIAPVSAVIPLAGGTLTSPFDQTNYIFPSGTFTDTVIVTHAYRLEEETPDFASLVGIEHQFELVAVYNDTDQPAQPAPSHSYTITIQYTDDEKGAAIEDSLALYYWNGSQWQKEPTSLVDLPNNTLIATPNHFSTWALLGETNRVFLPLIRR
jgi:hypothetical protein